MCSSSWDFSQISATRVMIPPPERKEHDYGSVVATRPSERRIGGPLPHSGAAPGTTAVRRAPSPTAPSQASDIEVFLDNKKLALDPGQTVMPHGIDRGLDPDEIRER